MLTWGVRPSLDGQHFDVVVVGGGINGVAIARECALSGRRTLLLEHHDFSSGTTSRSTRIIHGGLRYLEHGELTLVRQSLRERQHLLCERRHLVRPLNFVLAMSRDGASSRSALEIRVGLWLYRQMAGGRAMARDMRQQRARLEQLLDGDRRWALFDYEDAQCEFPERLVAEWLTEAVAAGAVARNHTEALEIDVREGNVQGVVLRDAITQEEARVSAARVFNATGPWADRICARSGVRTHEHMVGGIRGSHIVLSRFVGAPDAAIYSEATDGRPIFLVPWNDQILVGSTEVRDDDDPALTQPTESELEYLMTSVQRMFPRAGIGWEHLHYAFAGVRPLPHAPGESPHKITRRHALHDHADEGASGMISVIGGKLTTAAALARECVRKLGAQVPEPEPVILSAASCDGMKETLKEWACMVARRAETSVESARAIAEWHGRNALTIAGMAHGCDALRLTLCEHTPHLVAEAAEAVYSESAISLGDILLRRVPVALGACWSEQCSRIAAERIGYALRWNERQIGEQLENFEQERAAFLRKPTMTGADLQPRRAG